LFYRLNVVPVALPSLRERRADVPLLAGHFLDRAAEDGLPRKRLAADAVAVLEGYDWPGNVRQLENLMRRIAALSRDEVIDGEALRRALGEAGAAPAAGTRDEGIDAAVRARLERIAIEEPR
ncbi:nitrogen regulation protein NR(I), partial [Escherichia coli]|nr:nitrogen regulation protein NR(I) [Escherichia coli]